MQNNNTSWPELDALESPNDAEGLRADNARLRAENSEMRADLDTLKEVAVEVVGMLGINPDKPPKNFKKLLATSVPKVMAKAVSGTLKFRSAEKLIPLIQKYR